MRIVIVGYGRVGARTVRILDEEGHEVVIVENDPEKVKRARNAGFEVINGDGSNEAILREADLEAASALGGLTGDPNVNFTTCLVGREFNCRTVMRISEDYSESIYERYADDVDEIVYPERLGAAGAKTALLGGSFNAIGDLTEQLQLSVVEVPQGAPIIGEHVASIDVPDTARIYAHGREREPMTIPMPGTTVSTGDRLALILERDAQEAVRTSLLG
jgi:trk system potassium uptake protein TrkA